MIRIALMLLGGGLGILAPFFIASLEGAWRKMLRHGSASRIGVTGLLGLMMGAIIFSCFGEDIFKSLFVLASTFCLGVIFETDRRDQRIFLVPVLLIGGLGIGFHLLAQDQTALELCLGVMIGAIFFGTQYLVSKGNALGLGDVWLGIALGLLFGWSTLLFVLLLAYVGGAVVAILLLLTKRMKRTDPFPLGACLALAAVITLFVSSPWQWLGVL